MDKMIKMTVRAPVTTTITPTNTAGEPTVQVAITEYVGELDGEINASWNKLVGKHGKFRGSLFIGVNIVTH